jgi:hypothetical protein
MFHRGYVAAALAEGRRMIEKSRRFGDGRNEGIDVGPVKDDAVVRAGRMEHDPDMATRVQTNSGQPDAPDESGLGAHSAREVHAGCHVDRALFQGISRIAASSGGMVCGGNPSPVAFPSHRPLRGVMQDVG